jgi:hypothetical protein
VIEETLKESSRLKLENMDLSDRIEELNQQVRNNFNARPEINATNQRNSLIVEDFFRKLGSNSGFSREEIEQLISENASLKVKLKKLEQPSLESRGSAADLSLYKSGVESFMVKDPKFRASTFINQSGFITQSKPSATAGLQDNEELRRLNIHLSVENDKLRENQKRLEEKVQKSARTSTQQEPTIRSEDLIEIERKLERKYKSIIEITPPSEGSGENRNQAGQLSILESENKELAKVIENLRLELAELQRRYSEALSKPNNTRGILDYKFILNI